jgi:hypothetical protein
MKFVLNKRTGRMELVKPNTHPANKVYKIFYNNRYPATSRALIDDNLNVIVYDKDTGVVVDYLQRVPKYVLQHTFEPLPKCLNLSEFRGIFTLKNIITRLGVKFIEQ